MVHASRVARLHSVEDLEEELAKHRLVAGKTALLLDDAAQVPTAVVVENHELEAVLVDHTVQRDDVPDVRHLPVQDGLAVLVQPLEGALFVSGGDFDGADDRGVGLWDALAGTVDDTEGTSADGVHEPVPAIVERLA